MGGLDLLLRSRSRLGMRRRSLDQIGDCAIASRGLQAEELRRGQEPGRKGMLPAVRRSDPGAHPWREGMLIVAFEDVSSHPGAPALTTLMGPGSRFKRRLGRLSALSGRQRTLLQ